MEQCGTNESGRTIVIVGAGAAGMAAAIAAAEAGGPGVRVVLCEATDRVGRTVLATGNGRCNFSNARLAWDATAGAPCGCDLDSRYRNGEFVGRVLAAAEAAFPPRDALPFAEVGCAVTRFFADHGLLWREEGEGRLYPLANKATSVLDVLRAAMEAAQVEMLTELAVESIVSDPSSGLFRLRASDERELCAHRVIIACGGALQPRLAGELGLPWKLQEPVLGPLAVVAADKRLTKQLDNIRLRCAATLMREGRVVRCERGEVLFRPYGLSGIAVFDLSRQAQVGDEVVLDLLVAAALPEEASLRSRAERSERIHGVVPTYGDILRGMALPPVARVLCDRAQVDERQPWEPAGLDRLDGVVRGLRFTVEGISDARQCQVRRGGVAVEALDPATLEVRKAPGLFVVGEAVDVDGACGGFNLHWAWSSGLLAGRAAASDAGGQEVT